MLMIPRQAASPELLSFGGRAAVGIIKNDHPCIIAVMQGQRIGNPVGYLLTGSCYPIGLKLDSVALLQTVGNPMQIQQSVESCFPCLLHTPAFKVKKVVI
jgi:hypothetical protein